MALNLIIPLISITISTIFLQSQALLNPKDHHPPAPSPYGFISPPNASSPISPVAPPPSNSLVPALFVIGDSTVDAGTNNFLGTFARADHLPYGRDFDTHSPTGRFCNGRIPVDFLGIFRFLIFFVLDVSFRFDLCFCSLCLVVWSVFLIFLLYNLFFFFHFFYSSDLFSPASWTSFCSELSWACWSSGRYDSRSELCIS